MRWQSGRQCSSECLTKGKLQHHQLTMPLYISGWILCHFNEIVREQVGCHKGRDFVDSLYVCHRFYLKYFSKKKSHLLLVGIKCSILIQAQEVLKNTVLSINATFHTCVYSGFSVSAAECFAGLSSWEARSLPIFIQFYSGQTGRALWLSLSHLRTESLCRGSKNRASPLVLPCDPSHFLSSCTCCFPCCHLIIAFKQHCLAPQ